MDLWETALGFMDSQVLMTAEKLGVFAALDRHPLDTAELSRRIGLPADSTERLVTVLAAMGVLTRHNGQIANGPDASRQLVPGKPGYIGAMFRHVHEDLYPVWAHFEDALREQRPQWKREAEFNNGPERNEQLHQDPAAIRSFMEGMHSITYDAASHLAELWPGLSDITTVTDIGGAAGSFLIALAEHNPRLRGINFDLPHVRPIAEDLLTRHGVADRVRFQPGDFFTDDFPRDQDAYSLGFILHDWDDEAGTLLLRKIADAAKPGSLLILGEYLLHADRSGPLPVARQDLNMLVAARGRERSMEEYIAWLEKSGFTFEQVWLTRNGKNYMVARRSPRQEDFSPARSERLPHQDNLTPSSSEKDMVQLTTT